MHKTMTIEQKSGSNTSEYTDRCRQAKAFENSGEYEKAANILGDLWLGVGERPDVEDFPDEIIKNYNPDKPNPYLN